MTIALLSLTWFKLSPAGLLAFATEGIALRAVTAWFIRQRVRDALLMPISDPRVISSSIGALSHDC